ncbi:MAG TPA: pyridoxal phosphate-dependent aminotransferase, partial [Clostridiales bacterium]|nr:pyridoxal phosphate-dependent aminotransferase [Clostridiales bacterium]
SYAVAGLRIGCIYCLDPDIFQKIVQTSAVLTTAGGISSLSQIAGQACLEQCDYWLYAFVRFLQGNRDYAYERLEAMPGITVHKPQATYLIFPNIQQTGLDSEQMVDYLKREAKLALVPGSDQFFGPGSAGHVRLCFATSREILAEGLNRLETALKRL